LPTFTSVTSSSFSEIPRISRPPALGVERLALEDVLEQGGAERERALVDEHGDRRERDAPAERRGQRDGREAVQHRLRGERLVVAGQAVLDRADHRQWAHAEEQARVEECLAHVRG